MMPASKPLTAAQSDLAARHFWLAKSIARRAGKSRPGQWDDFQSAANLALVQAAARFDPARGASPATAATCRIWWAMREVIAAGYKHPPMEPLGKHPESRGRAMWTTADPPVGTEIETAELVEQWLQGLTAQQAKVCRSIYQDGRDQVETGRKLGLSRSRVCHLHASAIGPAR